MTRAHSKSRARRRQIQPMIGGVVGEDTTKTGRRRRARQDQAELSKKARESIKIPTTEEVLKIGQGK